MNISLKDFLEKQCYASEVGKRGNGEINNSLQAGIEPGVSRFKIQHSWSSDLINVEIVNSLRWRHNF